MPKRDLTLKHTSEGADKVVGDLSKIEQAERKLIEATQQLSTTLGTGSQVAIQQHTVALDQAKVAYVEAGGAAEGAAFQSATFLAAISGLNPRLGALARVLADFGRVGESVAKQDLGTIFTSLSGGVSKYAATLTLLGAGGAAFLAVMALSKAWKGVAVDTKAAQDQLEAFTAKAQEADDSARSLGDAVQDALIGAGIPLTDSVLQEAITRAKQVSDVLSIAQAAQVGAGVQAVPQQTLDTLRGQRLERRAEVGRDVLEGREVGDVTLQKLAADLPVTFEELKDGIEQLRKQIAGELPTVGRGIFTNAAMVERNEEIAAATIAESALGIGGQVRARETERTAGELERRERSTRRGSTQEGGRIQAEAESARHIADAARSLANVTERADRKRMNTRSTDDPSVAPRVLAPTE